MSGLKISSKEFLGTILVAFVAISFAANSTLAKVAYDYGASPLSFLTWRTAIAFVSVFVLVKLLKIPISLPINILWTARLMGLMLALYSYGLLGSIQYMPVALGVLTFYLYPVLTSVGVWLLGQEKLTVTSALCVLAAFLGLSIALGVGGGFHLLGIGFALGSAIMITGLLLTANSLGSDFDPRVVSFHVLFSATLIILVVDLISFEFPLPRESIGIIAFIGGGLFYAFSIIGMFIGLAYIGAVRTTLFMNFEPVSSIAFGAILLDQILTTFQLMGAALVIIAIVIAAVQKKD